MKNSITPLRVVFFGTPSFVIPVVEELQKHLNLVGVVTSPDAPQGRKHLLTPSPVKEYTLNHLPHLPIFTPEKFDTEIQTQLKDLKADIFIVAAYGKIIPQPILDLPQFKSINIHPSLLPKYRGTSPIQTMLLQGDKVSGVTIMQMDHQMDHGPIIDQWEIPIKESDTFASLHVSLFEDAAKRLPEVITQYVSGEISVIPQDDTKATFCQKITRESGYFDSNHPPSPLELDRMIRAYYPWPTAWTQFLLKGKETRVKFLPQQMIQPEGGKPMNMKDFMNGYPETKKQLEEIFGEKNK